MIMQLTEPTLRGVGGWGGGRGMVGRETETVLRFSNPEILLWREKILTFCPQNPINQPHSPLSPSQHTHHPTLSPPFISAFKQPPPPQLRDFFPLLFQGCSDFGLPWIPSSALPLPALATSSLTDTNSLQNKEDGGEVEPAEGRRKGCGSYS